MNYDIYNSPGVPIKAWTRGVPVEAKALEQVRNTASLPIIHSHVALMADCHFGFGATVGSVVPTIGAVIPAAVGVDIGCVDADSEYLSPIGWRRIADYDGGSIMQYERDSGAARFVEPEAYIKRESRGLLKLQTKYGVDQLVSPDHKMLVWKRTGRDRHREQVVMLASDFAAEHSRLAQGMKADFQTAFTPVMDTCLAISDEDLRVQVAVMADGYLDQRCHISRSVCMNLKKQRKQARLRELLQRAGREFTEHEHQDGATGFRFSAPIATKTYAGFWSASAEQLKIIADECLHWDGNAQDSVFYTRDRASADFMQYAFAATGHRSVMRSDDCDGVTDYRVYAHANTFVGMAGVPKTPIVKVPSPDGLEYCFTVPSGFWVMRRGGNVVMTGNCGMVALRTPWNANDLPCSLAGMRRAIESAVPHGRSSNGGPGDCGAWTDVAGPAAEAWRGMLPAFDRICEKHPVIAKSNNAVHLGTLGTGNHFVEVCLDEDDEVWVMLHSGSRGVGNRIGSHFIELAKKDAERNNIRLPDVDLAYLNEGSEVFDDYCLAVGWAQNFARVNRNLMLGATVGVLAKVLPAREWPATWADIAVNCHHNYVSHERHFGADVIVTRKGAVSAREGELGIIPGSMGTRSYIVRGKGNPDSFHSCSHGAGRVMSRGEAKRTITLEEHAKATEGVECRKDEGVLDESPAAYKNIDAVMAAQSDLVDIVHTLHAVLCVKG